MDFLAVMIVGKTLHPHSLFAQFVLFLDKSDDYSVFLTPYMAQGSLKVEDSCKGSGRRCILWGYQLTLVLKTLKL